MPASPSLLIVPARFKTGKLYTQIATTSAGVVLASSGDFNVTRATTATRFNSAGLIESVASGVPRLDYFTSGGTAGCPALLVEASGSNGILNSQDTTTSWVLGATLSSGYTDVIGVSGNNLTVAVSGSSIGSDAGVLRRTPNNVALASGSTYTLSFLMRQTSGHTIGGYYAVITGAGGGNLGGGFDVSGSFSSGQIYNTAFTTNRIRRVEQWGTDVYRCSETFTMTASGTLTQLGLAPTTAVNNPLHPAVGLGIAFAAPQIELGSVPTTFIPTTTTSATRNAEVINLSGAVSGCIGQTEGTIYLETNALVSGASDLFCFARATTNTVSISKNSSNIIQAIVYTSGPSPAFFIAASGTVLGNLKIAFAYKTGESALYINGVPIGTSSTAFSFAAALSEININSTGFFEGRGNQRISALSLYTNRLTNAELTALTTL
jgi:hypothetical protein